MTRSEILPITNGITDKIIAILLVHAVVIFFEYYSPLAIVDNAPGIVISTVAQEKMSFP